jgi:eukaryotic-like serine/threonine-protein kinase
MAQVVDLPRKLGRYALFDFVGRGGMAEIYLARADLELGASRLCVVKEILPHLASDPTFSEMLLCEAKLASRLSHANIVQVFDLGQTEDRLYLAMEYVEGYDLNGLLRACIKHGVAMPIEYALHIVMETLRGLDHAHRACDDNGQLLGLIHRDVSPSNILVSLDGEVKLCDFGTARASQLVQALGSLHYEAIQGKAGYMSPEQARGEPLDARADVFATGIVLWELLAGRRMYKQGGARSLLEQARSANVSEIPVRDLPGFAGLQAILSQALEVSRDRRTHSAGAMLESLEAWLSECQMAPDRAKLGAWLVQSFGRESFDQRRLREQVPLPAVRAPSREQDRDEAFSAELEIRVAAAVPAMRRPPLVRSVTPSPGAMRAFRELARNPDESAEVSQVEIVGLPASPLAEDERKQNARTWLFVVLGLLALLAAAYVALLQ